MGPAAFQDVDVRVRHGGGEGGGGVDGGEAILAAPDHRHGTIDLDSALDQRAVVSGNQRAADRKQLLELPASAVERDEVVDHVLHAASVVHQASFEEVAHTGLDRLARDRVGK